MNEFFDLAILDAALSVALADPSKVSDLIAANGIDLEDLAMSRQYKVLIDKLQEAHSKNQAADPDLLASDIAQTCGLDRKDVTAWLDGLRQSRPAGALPLFLGKLRSLRFRRRLGALAERVKTCHFDDELFEALEQARQEYETNTGAPLATIDFAAEPLPVPDPLIGDSAQQLIMPGEKVLIASDSGVGKTQLGVAIALGVASGTGVLGFPCQARPVVYVSSDFDPALEAKFRRQAAGRGIAAGDLARLPLAVIDDPEFCLDGPDYLRRLGATLENLGARVRPSVLVVETVSTNIRSKTTDLYNEISVRDFIRRTAGRLSRDFAGLTFNMSHHLKKAQAGAANDLASRVAGSVQLRAGFDSVIGLVACGKDRFTVRTIKRSRSGGTFQAFTVEIRGDRTEPLTVVNLGPADLTLDELRGAARAVMEFMRGVHRPMTTEAIAAGIKGFRLRAVQGACKRLAEADPPLLVRTSRKPATYDLSPQPADSLPEME
jgi:hypothetical protein